jgi:periplasmic protein CpxP/Spy
MKTILGIVASTFLIGAAYAQPSEPASHDASTAAMTSADAKHDMKVEKHIKDLHAKLKITPAEESQWADVVQTIRGSAIELDNAIDKRKAIVGSATAIDDLNAYGDIAQAHADGVKKLSAVFSKLYASMPDDQKKLADEVFAHRAHNEAHRAHKENK